jgi:hypothetical protein
VSGKIAVMAMIASACRLVFDHLGEMFRVGLVLILGIFAIGIFALHYILPLLSVTVPQTGGAAAGEPMPDPRIFPGMLLMLVVEFVFISVFAVGWHRLILLGPTSVRGLGVGIARRELAYFGRMWLCFLGVVVFTAVFSTAEYALAGLLHADPRSYLALASVGYGLVTIYALGRFGLSFAAVSIDRRLGFAGSWQMTRGEGLRILAIYVLVGLGWFVVTYAFSSLARLLGLGQAAPYSLLFINAVLSSGLIALVVTINALLLRQLTGWRAPV